MTSYIARSTEIDEDMSYVYIYTDTMYGLYRQTYAYQMYVCHINILSALIRYDLTDITNFIAFVRLNTLIVTHSWQEVKKSIFNTWRYVHV